jgi:hypothetical protein
MAQDRPVSPEDLDAVGRVLARWLAPYIAAELGVASTEMSPAYDAPTCAVFVSTLGDVVLDSAEVFFGLLAEHGSVASVRLADALGVSGPRHVPSVLTTPLKRRAKALGLPKPWGESSHERRTVWLDEDETAVGMLEAIRAEKARRAAR